MTTIQTSRFGQVKIDEEDIILFGEGILGFSNLRQFILVEDPTDEIFVWLQSCELADVAFPVLEPEMFQPNFKVSLSKNDLEALGMDNVEKSRVFSIVTIPQDPTNMTANLKAPLVINVEKRLARQCVLQDNGLAIREPIFALLQQRLVQAPLRSAKKDTVQSVVLDLGVSQKPAELSN